MPDRALTVLIAVFAVVQLLLGIGLWATPGFFYDDIGPYGPRNDHYMGDLGTFYLAQGAVTLAAVRIVSWRVPLLAFAVLQYALHTVNHLIDVGEADPEWLGPANLASIGLTTALLGWMLVAARREREAA
jgi:uncharacterized membrane protein